MASKTKSTRGPQSLIDMLNLNPDRKSRVVRIPKSTKAARTAAATTTNKKGTTVTTTETTPEITGHGTGVILANGATLYNDDRPYGKSGKGGVVKAHGTSTGYQRGCRCDECKAAMSAYTTSRRDAGKSAEQIEAEKKAAKAAKDKARREAKKAEAAQAEATTTA